VKTIAISLLLVSAAVGFCAQTPTNAPATNAPGANTPAAIKAREDAMRRLIERTNSRVLPTNLAARPTNMLAPAAAPADRVPPPAAGAPAAAGAAPVIPPPLDVPAPGQPKVGAEDAAPPAAAPAGPPAFPAPMDRSQLLSNIAALRARSLTNPAASLTNPALRGLTNVGTAATAGPRAAPPGLTGPGTGARPTPAVVAPAAPGAAPAAPNVAGAPAAPGPAPAAGAPGAAAAAAPKPGATNDVAEDIIPPGEIRFQDVDANIVLEYYQELTGRNVLRPTSLPATKINIKTVTPLTRREAVLALDSILSMNGITMVPQGEKFVKAVPQAQANTEALKFYTNLVDELPEAGVLVTYVLQLKNALPQDVATVLQQFAKMPGNSILAIPSTSTLVLRDYAENVKRMVEIAKLIDVVTPRDYESAVIPIKYALAGDIANVLGSLSTGGGVTTVGQQQTRSGLSTGGGGFGTGGMGGMGGLGGAGGIGGLGGMQGQQGYNQNLQGRSGLGSTGLGSQTAGRSSFSDRLRNIVSKASAQASGEIVAIGQTKIIADERTNSLLIYATKDDLDTIKDIISKLDVVLAQVLIETLIFEVALDDNLSYGVSYLQRQPTTSGNFTGIGAVKNSPIPTVEDFSSVAGGSTSTGTGTSTSSGTGRGANLPSGFTYLARWGNFDIAAQAIASDSRVNILSRPRVQTSHAVEANLFVGQTRPYPTGTSYGGYYGGYSSIQQLQIGITLSVLPLINPDGLVVMDIRQKIQSVGGEVEIANVGKVPETIDREVNAKVAVRDRETVALGGFISNERRKSASGVPLLKDIPLLGNLFRSTSKSGNRKELMILIRPTVLPTPTDAAIAAADEKAKMPAVTQLDLDAQKEERTAQEKSRKEIKAAQDELHKEILKREGLPY
jgi:general secretion pathway protein D